MTTQELIKSESEHIMQTYGRFPVALERGSGAKLYSPEGREYIDFTAGIGVNSMGYANEKWVAAVTEQAGKLAHTSNLFYTEPCIRLAETLTAHTGLSRVFFCNSGAEANEGMIKLARKYSYDKYGRGRATIITLHNSFHGRTITTLKATGQAHFHDYFFPFTEGFRYAMANSMESLHAAYSRNVCAVMLEPIQGEGGVCMIDPDYVRELREFCDERDLLLMFDEVQTGIGRTGKLFAYEHFGVTPDAVSFAKGIGGGLPIGGFICPEKTAEVLGKGQHGTTFGGNPVACAGACAVLEQLDDALLAEVTEKGNYMRSVISGWNLDCVADVRGTGLMTGVQLRSAEPGAVAAKCVENGLLMLTAGSDVLRMLPPLVITRGELDQGLEILKSTLEAI